MKKLALGLTALFALSTAVPAFAAEKEEGAKKEAKAGKKGGKKAPKKGEDKKGE
ncbi:MAG: hypothetical protein JNJ46_23240 [Myxococcales bacterium]|nr:hypothetical protein [Myxococcales bacterium]